MGVKPREADDLFMWEVASVLGLAQPPKKEEYFAAGNNKKYDHLHARVEGRQVENWGGSSFGQIDLMQLAGYEIGE